MSPTCAKSRSKVAIAAALCAATLCAGSAWAQAAKRPAKGELEAPVAGAVTVSDYEFNTFVFPDVIKRIYFPAGSPVVGKPMYLSDNTQVLLQFAKGSGKPVQMVAELEGGQVVSMRLAVKSVPGTTHNVGGGKARVASPKKADADSAQSATPRGEDIELLKGLVSSGQPPSGFDPVALPRPTRFDKFSVIPLAGWSDGVSKRVLVFSLVATPGQTAVVAPPQFYRPGISAVMIDGDVVDNNHSPQLFVVEELSDE